MVKLIKFLSLLLLSASLCMAQQGKQTDDSAFEETLLKLLEPLQQKRLPDYLPGTEMISQNFLDEKPYGPELRVVLKAPLPGQVAVYQSSLLREPLPAKPDEDDPANNLRPRPAELQIDGHTVKCLLRAEPVFDTVPLTTYGNIVFLGTTVAGVKRQWVLAANPKIVLREERAFLQLDKWFWHTNPSWWWAVTSVGVKKKVGDHEYQCVELQYNDHYEPDRYSITADYLSPDIPYFRAEQEEVFYHLGQDQKKTVSYVRRWKLLNIKLPAKASEEGRPVAPGPVINSP